MSVWKWVVVMGVATAMALAATGCSDSDDGSKDPLVGTWKAVSFNGQPIPSDIALTIVIRDNGTFTATTRIGGATDETSGTWSAANGILTTVSNGDTDRTPYSVSGKTLTLGPRGEQFILQR